MTQYLILIYGNEQRWDSMRPQEMQQIDEGHRTFRAKAGAAILASGQLESSATAVTLRAGLGGEYLVSDGPFQETKEVVGGFYLVEASDREEVVSLASLLAEVRHDHSGVEITRLVEHGPVD
jgi:hypothetical protein